MKNQCDFIDEFRSKTLNGNLTHYSIYIPTNIIWIDTKLYIIFFNPQLNRLRVSSTLLPGRVTDLIKCSAKRLLSPTIHKFLDNFKCVCVRVFARTREHAYVRMRVLKILLQSKRGAWDWWFNSALTDHRYFEMLGETLTYIICFDIYICVWFEVWTNYLHWNSVQTYNVYSVRVFRSKSSDISYIVHIVSSVCRHFAWVCLVAFKKKKKVLNHVLITVYPFTKIFLRQFFFLRACLYWNKIVPY